MRSSAVFMDRVAAAFVAVALLLTAGCTPEPPEAASAPTARRDGEDPCRRPSTDYRPHEDHRTLHGLLVAQDFAALEKTLDELRRDYGARYCSDRPFGMAFEALSDGAPALEANFAAWVAARPDSAHALAARGSHYLDRGWTIRGARTVDNTSTGRFERMNELFELAVQDLVAALRLDPAHVPAGMFLIRLAMHGAGAEAVLGLHSQLTIGLPDSHELGAALLVALTPKWGGSEPLMHEAARRLADRAGHNPDLALLTSHAECLSADHLRFKDRDRDAMNAFMRIRKQYMDKFSPSCWLYLARLQNSIGSNADAVNSYQRYFETNGLLISADSAANGLIALDRLGEAEELLHAALEINHGSPDLHCELAVLELNRKRYQVAREHAQRGLNLVPDDPYCTRVASKISRFLRDSPDRRIEQLQKIGDDSKLSGRYHIELGAALLEQRKDAEALAALDQGIELGSDDAASLYYRALAHERLGNLSQALEDANRAVRQSPDDPALLATRARIRIASGGNAPSVIDDLRRSLAAGGGSTEDYYVLAGAYYKRRDCEVIPSLREYLRRCADQNCNRDNLAFAERMLANPGFRKECPQHFR